MDAFNSVFEVVRTFDLEENEDVVTVAFNMTLDTTGDLIVTDLRETQIRFYDQNGSLKGVMGRHGGGPGEFNMPMVARRTTDGRIVVPDVLLARLTFFGADTVTATSPITMLMDINDLGDGRFLVVGPGSPANQQRLLHIWNAETEQLERSFFPKIVRAEHEGYAQTYGSPFARLHDGTIWAGWALSDSIFRFDTDGNRTGAIPVSLPRPRRPFPDLGDGPRDISEIGNALDSIVVVTDVSIDGAGDIVVQSSLQLGMAFEVDLTIMDRQGNVEAQLIAGPRLILVNGDDYYFSDPDPLLMNRIMVARRR